MELLGLMDFSAFTGLNINLDKNFEMNFYGPPYPIGKVFRIRVQINDIYAASTSCATKNLQFPLIIAA